MKTLSIAIILLIASTVSAGSIEDQCKATCKYRDRKAYYVDQNCFNRCVPEAYKRAEERKTQRLQDQANQAIIDQNRTYQRNSEDLRRWMRANPGLPYPGFPYPEVK